MSTALRNPNLISCSVAVFIIPMQTIHMLWNFPNHEAIHHLLDLCRAQVELTMGVHSINRSEGEFLAGMKFLLHSINKPNTHLTFIGEICIIL